VSETRARRARRASGEKGAKDISPGAVPVFKIHVQSLLP